MSFKRLEKFLEGNHYKNHIVISDNYNKVSVVNIDTVFQQDLFFEVVKFIKDRVGKGKLIYINIDLHFYGKSFIEVDLSYCIFEKDVVFHTCTFDGTVDFILATFKEEANFEKSKFLSNTKFHFAKFEISANFENTVFNKLVDFYDATFEDVQSFYKTDFLDRAIFSHVKFKKQAQFIYNKVKSDTVISFENTVFNQSLDISRSNFWCKVQFWGIKINIDNIIPSEFWLYENDYIEDQSTKDKKLALARVRESYRRIKQEFSQEGNNIEALKFHKYEMLVYKNEATIDKNEIKTEDKITLWFNKWSNNFGSSWTTGLGFTVIVSMVFYTIFLFAISDKLYYNLDSLSETLKYFIQFLNITVWEYKPFGLETYSGWGYLAFFIGRIFIGYGYYQTIQAFRKYGSN